MFSIYKNVLAWEGITMQNKVFYSCMGHMLVWLTVDIVWRVKN